MAPGYGVQASGGSAVVSRVRDDTLAQRPEAKHPGHDQVTGDEVSEKARRDQDEDPTTMAMSGERCVLMVMALGSLRSIEDDSRYTRRQQSD